MICPWTPPFDTFRAIGGRQQKECGEGPLTGGGRETMSKSLTVRGMGNIERLGRNKWRIRVSLGKDPVTKKYRRSHSRTVYGNKTDAINALEELKSELRMGKAAIVAPRTATVDSYARMFHYQRQGSFGSPLAFKREELEIRRIERFFGGYALEELTPYAIREAYYQIRKQGLMSEGELHKMHLKLGQVMKQAVADGLVASNPCANISAPRPKPAERKSLSAEEAARLNDILLQSPRTAKNAAVMIALHTGMRRGEVLGLTWADVDLEKRKLTIRRQFDSDRTLREPKTEKSKRTLSLSEACTGYLADWRRAQRAVFEEINDAAMGKWKEAGRKSKTFKPLEVGPDTPVVSNELGGFTDPNVFSRWFRGFCVEKGFGTYGEQEPVIDAAGRKRIRKAKYEGLNFHELRHTQATLLIGSGADIKTVQTRLGHSSAQLTMNIYAHAIEANDRDAADAIGDILSGK